MYDFGYLMLVVLSLALGLATQGFINMQYRRYSKVVSSSGLTGEQVARRMLDANGLANVVVRPVGGTLTDNFDPRSNVVSLSQGVFDGRSVAATAIACHECGHALQHARAFAPSVLRQRLFPVVNIASSLWMLVLFLGFSLEFLQLVWLALLMFACVVLFQLVTLPVECDASARAMEHIGTVGFLPEGESKGARRVLVAASLTYVASALISVLQFVYFLGRSGRRR